MNGRYREATFEDAVAIATLHAESWRGHYRGAYLDEYLDGEVFQDRIDVWNERLSVPHHNQFVILCEEEDRLTGFACAYGCDDERWGTLLDNIHVRRERQRQGRGARLVSEVAKWCREHHADRGLYLWVLGQNKQAQRFYERLGATDRGGQFRAPSVGGGEPRDVRRYAWTTLSEIVDTRDG